MANYITMAVRPSTGAVYDFFKRVNPDVIERYTYLANSLDDLLVQSNMNLVDLFKHLAIRYIEFKCQILSITRASSGGPLPTLRRFLGNCQAALRWTSGSPQTALRRPLGSHL